MKTVLSIGQCVPDNSTLRGYLSRNFQVNFQTAETWDEAEPMLRKQKPDLILINRKLDIDYSDGLVIIEKLKADDELNAIPVMLVSNYPEHQQSAVALGAVPGFGKLEYQKPETLAKLQAILA